MRKACGAVFAVALGLTSGWGRAALADGGLGLDGAAPDAAGTGGADAGTPDGAEAADGDAAPDATAADAGAGSAATGTPECSLDRVGQPCATGGTCAPAVCWSVPSDGTQAAGDAGPYDCGVCQASSDVGDFCEAGATCGDAGGVCTAIGGGSEPAVAPDGGLANAYFTTMQCKVPEVLPYGSGDSGPPPSEGCAMQIAPRHGGSLRTGEGLLALGLVGAALRRRGRFRGRKSLSRG